MTKWQGCGNSKNLILAQGQVNGHNVLVQWKIYLSHRTDTAQRTQLALTFADKLFKNSMKPDIISIENSVDPVQLDFCFLFSIQHGIVSS